MVVAKPMLWTNAGAGEMRDRIKGFCSIAGIDVEFDKITISTIHSFGDSLLKQYYNLLGYKKPPVLINEIQRTKIIEEMTIYKDTELKIYLGQAMFRNIQIRKKNNWLCVTAEK